MKMKKTYTVMVSTALIMATAGSAFADDGRGKGGRGFGHERPSFGEIDTNGDGQITAAEVTAMHQAKFAEMDADGNGEISADEFTAHAERGHADRAAKMIEQFDADKSGGLSQDEMPRRGGDDVDRVARMIEHLDSNGDGQISQEEFDAAPMRGGKRHGKDGAAPADDNASGISSN